MTKTWSAEQTTIFNWFEHGDGGHAIGRARAGTGKTTTIIEGVNRAPEQRILLAAFNKRIADELNARITNPRAEAKTLHAVGFAALRRAKSNVRLLNGSERADWLAKQVCDARVPDRIVRLVSKLHTHAREMNPFAQNGSDLLNIAEQFDCVPDEDFEAMGYTVNFVADRAFAAMQLGAREMSNGIDFADMIFLPLVNGWLVKTYDLVVVDEAQDMTLAQLEIAKRVCNGRIMVVGDDRQAIYAFRGADSESLDRLKAELHAVEFPLCTTYRCGRSIVALAQAIVPDFVAGPENPEGVVRGLIGKDALLSEVAAGDFILSRLNAPLVSLAMALLRQGRPAQIAGRDLGAGLKAIVRKLSKVNSVPAFLTRLGGWRERELRRAMTLDTEARREAKSDLVNDQYDMLTNLAEGAVSVRDIEARIDALFADGLKPSEVIVLSSVHRSKGLEAERVFVLSQTLKDTTTEERNIRYVAYTRAKAELVLVDGVK